MKQLLSWKKRRLDLKVKTAAIEIQICAMKMEDLRFQKNSEQMYYDMISFAETAKLIKKNIFKRIKSLINGTPAIE